MLRTAAIGLLLASWAVAASCQTLALFPASQYGRNYLTLPQSAAGLSTTQLQNVLGRNANFERLDSYRADDRFRKMAAPVGRLDLLIEGAGGTGVGNCTASIISQRYIMTNSHCFPSRDRVVRGSLLMDFYSEDNDRDARRFEIATAPAEVNAELDYAIVEVRGNPSAAFGTVRLDPRDPQPGESLLIIHHPMGLPKHMTRGGCRAYQPNAVDGVDIRHRCDTLPGSSGSPILAEATGRMVGLHYGGTTNPSATSWNSGKRLAEIARRSRILAAAVAEQRQDDEASARASSPPAEADRAALERAALERAETERKAREQAAQIGQLRAQVDAEMASLRAQLQALNAERARLSAVPSAPNEVFSWDRISGKKYLASKDGKPADFPVVVSVYGQQSALLTIPAMPNIAAPPSDCKIGPGDFKSADGRIAMKWCNYWGATTNSFSSPIRPVSANFVVDFEKMELSINGLLSKLETAPSP